MPQSGSPVLTAPSTDAPDFSASIVAEPALDLNELLGPVQLLPVAPWKVRAANLTVVVVPFLGLIVAGVLLWGVAFSWVYLALLGAMYLATGLGITVGFHRLFTHKSFDAKPWVKFVFGVLGSMAIEGPLMRWVSDHRTHHTHSDEEGDPHSPHLHGSSLWGAVRGAWHSHMGWLFDADARRDPKTVKDLQADPVARSVDRYFFLWVAIGIGLPALAGGLLTMSWLGALLGMLWGGLVRVFLVHHVTWSVNSVCHLWGSRPYQSRDHSRNNPIVGVLAMGEGWHNNHHAFPSSARHGLSWWQFDLSYIVIWTLQKLGLVWAVRVPARTSLDVRRR